ncbi:hydrogenase-4 component H [Escherichia coli]|nr:hydrogenase-4 component H [Escherichia coli]
MLKLLKTIMRAGTATVKYPFAPLEVSPGFRGKPDLMPSQCIACGGLRLCLSGKCADYPDRRPAKFAHLAALSGALYLLRTL